MIELAGCAAELMSICSCRIVRRQSRCRQPSGCPLWTELVVA